MQEKDLASALEPEKADFCKRVIGLNCLVDGKKMKQICEYDL